MDRTKWYAKPIYALLALALVLSLGIMAVPLAGTVEADSGATAAFSASPIGGPAPLQVKFTNESSGDIDSRSWDFGDGNTSTAKNPTHTYMTVGRHTVTLTVKGPGGTDKASADITVIPMEAVSNPAKMSTSYLHISNPQVQPNQQVDISVNVANTGGESGIYNAVLIIDGPDGRTIDSQMVTVSPKSTQNAVFHVTKSTPGTYQVSLEGEVGQFIVQAPPQTSYFPGGLGTAGIITIAVVVIVLIVAIVLLARSRRT